MQNIILLHKISDYAINHIKSSNIIKWLTMIQTKREKERERERITKRNTDRLREWKSWRQNEDTRREKNRKTKIYQKYVQRGDTKIRNEKIKKNTKIHQKLKRGISQE